MFVRVARFEGGDASGLDAQMDEIRGQLAEGRQNPSAIPAGLRSVKRVLTLVDREGGKVLGLTFCDTKDDLAEADRALNAMSPSSGRRTSVEMYEVAIDESMG